MLIKSNDADKILEFPFYWGPYDRYKKVFEIKVVVNSIKNNFYFEPFLFLR